MSVQSALDSLIDTVPDCILAGYLDLEIGMMIGTAGPMSFSGDVVDNLTAAVVNLFESSHSIGIENAFRQATGREHDLEPYFRELVVVTSGLVHAFVRASGTENRILCFVSKASAGPARVLEAARSAARRMEEAAN
jgi:hypothetical protein